MSFNWEEYLLLANKLLESRGIFAPAEACTRTAISRAYYAAFISARDLAARRRKIILNIRKSVHRQVRNFFEESNDKDYVMIGALLKSLARKRNMADYDSVMTDSGKEAEGSVRLATDILALLRVAERAE